MAKPKSKLSRKPLRMLELAKLDAVKGGADRRMAGATTRAPYSPFSLGCHRGLPVACSA